MSEKIKAGVIGATGYAGLELCRLLLMHPQAELVAISSKSFEGMELSEVYPALYRETEERLCDSDEVIAKSEVVFGSVPHGLSEEYARKCVDKGAVFIDMGADFRLSDPADYKEWYGGEYKDAELHSRSTYAPVSYTHLEVGGLILYSVIQTELIESVDEAENLFFHI